MEKRHSGRIAVLLFVSVIVVSCSGKQGEKVENSAAVVAAEVKPVTVSSVILYDTAAKWNEDAQGNMAFSESSSSGDVVEACMIPDPASPDAFIAEEKKAIRLTDKLEREFYHIQVEGKDYWIQDLFLAVDAIPGVISSDNAILYTKPNALTISASALTLPQYSIVGVHPKESTSDFLCVSAYVPEFSSTVVNKQFIKRDMATTDSRDLQVLRLYNVAKVNKNEIVKRELLNDAMSVGGNFNYLIVEALDELSSSEIMLFTVAPYTNDGNFITADEENGTINIRNKPGVNGSEILFTVSAGIEIVVTEITNETETIDGNDNYWYKITIPSMNNREGWIFGRYISANPS